MRKRKEREGLLRKRKMSRKNKMKMTNQMKLKKLDLHPGKRREEKRKCLLEELEEEVLREEDLEENEVSFHLRRSIAVTSVMESPVLIPASFLLLVELLVFPLLSQENKGLNLFSDRLPHRNQS
jgi:hypothetical protein